MITVDDLNITVECLPEDMPIRGNYIVSGDDTQDRADELECARRLEFNPWAWCCVRVECEYEGLTADTYLGCCSYDGESDFVENSGYYDDMVQECLDAINNHAARIADRMFCA